MKHRRKRFVNTEKGFDRSEKIQRRNRGFHFHFGSGGWGEQDCEAKLRTRPILFLLKQGDLPAYDVNFEGLELGCITAGFRGHEITETRVLARKTKMTSE